MLDIRFTLTLLTVKSTYTLLKLLFIVTTLLQFLLEVNKHIALLLV